MVFFSPGDIQYHCHIHQSMTGTLHVVPSTGRAPLRQQVLIFDDGNATHTTQMGFAGASGSNRTTLAAGDSVEWENEGSLVHDVAMYLPSSASESGLGAWGMVAAVVAVVAVVAILMARQLRRRPPREG